MTFDIKTNSNITAAQPTQDRATLLRLTPINIPGIRTTHLGDASWRGVELAGIRVTVFEGVVNVQLATIRAGNRTITPIRLTPAEHSQIIADLTRQIEAVLAGGGLQ